MQERTRRVQFKALRGVKAQLPSCFVPLLAAQPAPAWEVPDLAPQ